MHKPIPYALNFEKPFRVAVFAKDIEAGAVLAQKDDLWLNIYLLLLQKVCNEPEELLYKRKKADETLCMYHASSIKRLQDIPIDNGTAVSSKVIEGTVSIG